MITWGSIGGDSSQVSSSLSSGVSVIYATSYAFAALKTDGSVSLWRSLIALPLIVTYERIAMPTAFTLNLSSSQYVTVALTFHVLWICICRIMCVETCKLESSSQIQKMCAMSSSSMRPSQSSVLKLAAQGYSTGSTCCRWLRKTCCSVTHAWACHCHANDGSFR